MIPKPPNWMSEALCAQVDAELFFPEVGEHSRPAKLICRRCDVRIQCLQYSVDHNIAFGVWGGMSGRERRNLKRAS